MTDRAPTAGRPRVLVTGATGFIGRRLTRRLLSQFGPESLVCFVKRSDAPHEREALEALRAAGVRLIEGDLEASPVTAAPPPPVDLVFHLAANIDTDLDEAEIRVNDLGTARLLDWLAPLLRGVRILYASSVAVHDRDEAPAAPITESSPFVPRTAYGLTKLRGERILNDRARELGHTTTIVRLPTVYGPGQKPGGLFDQMIARARTGGLLARVRWPGRTSVIYVDDAVDVMTEFAQRPDVAGNVYCLASREQLIVADIARSAGVAVGRPVRPIDLPPVVWSALQAIAWSHTLRSVMPRRWRLAFWRLSLIVSDGFWFDASKFHAAYGGRLRTLEEGLAELLSASPRT